MPLWVASVPRSKTSCRAKAIDLYAHALHRHKAASSRWSNLRIRAASTLVSPIAINYRPNIPARNKELHEALSGLSGAAEQYVNLSRLQLALGGLAVEDAVTRVAVLGLNSQVGAQRLTRLLLADPLGVEEQWEKELNKAVEGDGKAVLLRFGDEADAHPPSPLYKILSVPSRILGTHNLEILVSTLNVNIANTVTSSATESSTDALFVPKLETISARTLPVPYPVHKTLVLGEGLDSAIAYGRYTSDSTESMGDMVEVAIDLPAPSKEVEPTNGSTSTPVNVEVGTQALSAIRISVQNATVYERSWFASGLPALSTWLVQNLHSEGPIKAAHKALVTSVLDNVEANITREDARQRTRLASSTTQEQVGAEMVGSLEAWAEKSHEELRDDLDQAFTGRNWRKLGWWKLFWRVDDVTMVLEDVLERRWLTGAEKEAVYLAGRMKQAGFPEEIRHLPTDISDEAQPATINSNIPIPQEILTAETQTLDISTDVQLPTPWPSLIPSTRAALLGSTLPSLQALAQRLVLTTLSTTSLSSAASVLLYVSVSTVSMFEASAIAALGLVVSLRRMQKVWEDTRAEWQVIVREEGRQTLKRVEGLIRLIVRGRKAGSGVSDEDADDRRRAREAVEKVREALEKMER